MNLPTFSVKRPVTITCLFLMSLLVGVLSISKIGIDLFPNVSFPIVAITTLYQGASPEEIETLITKKIEDDLSTISGIKRIKSINKEGVSTIIVEFTMDTDIRFAEQKIKDRVSSVKRFLPKDIDEPDIKTFDPSDAPILVLSLTADISESALYDLATNQIRPMIEQVNHVGFVETVGGRKREYQVSLDRELLNKYQLSATQVSNQLASVGKNIPAGKIKDEGHESIIRTLGEFKSIHDIEMTVVSFYGNDVPVRVSDIATVSQGYKDIKSKTYVNGQSGLNMLIFKQSGANTLDVVRDIKKQLAKIETYYKEKYPKLTIGIVRDGGKPIKANVDDVKETITIGIVLTILVVLLFLGNIRSTFITGIAIPNSLLCAISLMYLFGFTLNVMTLLAISLSIGLLIDDAIVVRENIFRHLAKGKTPFNAALEGTLEVQSAVIATMLTILAVFGPIAFMHGMVSQFFKEFGLTICFIMLISTLDALTMAPMLSAYFAGSRGRYSSVFLRPLQSVLDVFNFLQIKLTVLYERILKKSLAHPVITVLITALICVASIYTTQFIPKTFTPPQDIGEFIVKFDLPPGVTLDRTDEVTRHADEIIHKHPEIFRTVATVGGRHGEANSSEIFIQLVPIGERKQTTSQFKEVVRKDLIDFHSAAPKIMDQDGIGGAQQPFIVNIIGSNLDEISEVGARLYDKLKNHPDLKDVDFSTKSGNPEIKVNIDKNKSQRMGVTSNIVGMELRTLVEGSTPAIFRDNAEEYDIRVRLKESQRDISKDYSKILVPNINGRLIRLTDVANLTSGVGSSEILRQDRGRYVMVSADINASGKGLSKPMQDVKKLFDSGEIKLKPGMSYEFYGQAENFEEMAQNMGLAFVLAILLIYFVLASLYESFITPFTIMLVIPLAGCGAIYALWLCHSSLDIFSIIGCILLSGIATKNSILLIEYIQQLLETGLGMHEAIVTACTVRLRPILMTALSLVAGMMPVAIGLNEASSQRTSMGIAVIGGVISSTLLTLVLIPAVYQYIDKFKRFVKSKIMFINSRPASSPQGLTDN